MPVRRYGPRNLRVCKLTRKAFHPLRLKNFAAFEIGRTFVKVKSKW
jgi:hypothetical protein